MKPIRVRLFDLFDVLVVSDADQIQWLNQHEHVTRPIDPARSALHRFIDRRLREDLGFQGEVLPVFKPKADPHRAARQKLLDDQLQGLRGLPGDERDRIADYVSGHNTVAEIGPVVQQWCGQLFFGRYKSTAETYEAGKLLSGWPSAPPWKTWKDRLTGKLERAKALLATAAEGDLHCVHATSIGMENVARTVRNLRKAAANSEKQLLSPDDILRECLAVPPVVLRGCSAEVSPPFLDRPLSPRSLIVFLVGRAYATSGDLDVAFLADSWSACPARRVIPEMLRSVWHAAHHDEAEAKRLMSTINSWSRLWHRAVS